MFGLFGTKKPAQAGGPQLPQMSFTDKLSILGGGLRDLDWTSGGGHMGAARGRVNNKLAKLQEEAEKQRQLGLLKEATQGMTPQQAAMAQLAPSAFAQRGLANTMLNPLDVRGADRADRLADNTIGNTEFNQNMATDRFGYTKERDNAMDSRYYDERDYTRGRDETMDKFRERQFNRGILESDRNYGLNAQGQAFNQGVTLQSLNAPQTKPMTPLEQQRYEMNEQKMAQEKKAREDASALANMQSEQMLGNLSRFAKADPNDPKSKDGDLAGAFEMLYGKSRYVPFGNVAGSKRADAKAIIDQVTSGLTIESLSAFKGAISEKEMAVAAAAATRLQNPNISEEEARRALAEIEQVMSKAYNGGSGSSNQSGQYPEGTVIENAQGNQMIRRGGQWVNL